MKKKKSTTIEAPPPAKELTPIEKKEISAIEYPVTLIGVGHVDGRTTLVTAVLASENQVTSLDFSSPSGKGHTIMRFKVAAERMFSKISQQARMWNKKRRKQ